MQGQAHQSGLDAGELEELVHEADHPVDLGADLAVIPSRVVGDCAQLGRQGLRGDKLTVLTEAARFLTQAPRPAPKRARHGQRGRERDDTSSRGDENRDRKAMLGQEHRARRAHHARDHGEDGDDRHENR